MLLRLNSHGLSAICFILRLPCLVGAYLIFRAISAALIRGQRLFKDCTREIYFYYIFIQRYTFHLLIFLWTDTKLIMNLELREKFTPHRGCGAYSRAVLINFFVPGEALIGGRRLFE